jgi:serine/threonine protein kinase
VDNLLGRKLEHYHIDQLLGEGGMGAVYRAQDINLGRFVALKVMHPHLARRDDFKQRFLIEGQATARMDHSGIAKILAFGQDADQLYMVMEYVAGGSLSDYIFQLRKEGRVVELREMLYLVAQVADALDYAHRRHILHRDLKPDNILLKRLEKPERPNEPPFKTLISDFGLAKLLDEDPFTNVNAVMGTLAYMSPEQALSRPLDGRSDLYSLGVMLYQLATGQLPFNIKSPTDAVLKHRDKMPPPPEQVKPGLPPTVAAIINKSLAKSPRGRYQTGEMLARELRQAAGQLSATDVTHFEAEIPVLSLVTILRPEVESPPPQPSLIRPQQTLPEGQYLIIARKGQLPRPQLMSGSRLTIGRSKTADVVLDDESISRSHARLERVSGGGWRVVDLNSINGTNLDGSKLLPDVAHPWQQGQSLQIGPYYLTWEGSAAATQTIIATRTEIQTAVQSVGATVLRSTIDNLDIIVEPNTVTVDAGGVGEINDKIVNSGAQVGH